MEWIELIHVTIVYALNKQTSDPSCLKTYYNESETKVVLLVSRMVMDQQCEMRSVGRTAMQLIANQ